MFIARYVTQPEGRINYLALFEEALRHATYNRFDVAVAYATMRGVDAIVRPFRGVGADIFDRLEKRWLVGIDWCRSDPVALERLSTMPNSSIKIPDGIRTVGKRGCTPVVPFHPKAFILRGPEALAIVSGSGNLSENGLTKGHECGSVLLFKAPLSETERALQDAIGNVATWFDAMWGRANRFAAVAARYTEQHDAVENLKSPVATDDDAADTDRTETNAPWRRAVSPERLRQLRAARHFWIEAGNLHENRGPGRSGNQLMMSPMTRVYFGFPATDVPPDTAIGTVSIRYGRDVRGDRSIRFSNNSMDVLTLPVPGDGGPPAYDREPLLFEKRPDKTFALRLGTPAERREWEKKSNRIGATFRMSSGRTWGVF